ncbi:MAG: AraC family transcriptional regulator [Verrucomicrobiota bacterium]|nr:AraC family transcriptional regulator [Verrucomicrobiota bacterium]
MPLHTSILPGQPLTKSHEALHEEGLIWSPVGEGWHRVHGSFQKLGFSFEWHDFRTAAPFDWARSFHPGSVEVCLNLSGSGTVRAGEESRVFNGFTGGFYCQGKEKLIATREANQAHQFFTVEFTPEFLKKHLAGQESVLHPLIRKIVLKGQAISGVGDVAPLSGGQQQLIASLKTPPVSAAAQDFWYRTKAMEILSHFFFRAPEGEDFFCTRQKKIARDRVEKAMALLKENLSEPPSLEEIGKQVGCSPFYLSRTFSKEMGMSIPQYLRQLRLERGAELLRSGKFNVTEAAMEVGYSSVSHFSQAFHEMYGCCPGLYPLKPGMAKPL